MSSRRLYSWWWDSHNSPKNSKWLQENLKDMDAKVKAMIKLIEEDADSFARRAEMYYKRRPELMKLVEEFYRAYRALAERYDHATVELRYAHRTMAEAFPDQMSFPADDSSSCSSVCDNEHNTPDLMLPARAILEASGFQMDITESSSSGSNFESSDSKMSKKALQQLTNKFESGEVDSKATGKQAPTNSSGKSQDHKSKAVQASEADPEFETLKRAVAEMQAETEAVFLQYQQTLDKVSILESKLSIALMDAKSFDEQKSKAKAEIRALKDALEKLVKERDAGLLRYKQCLDTISQLEIKIYLIEQDGKGLGERAAKAETESQNLQQEMSRLVEEKESVSIQYKQCVDKITDLENKLTVAEEDTKILAQRNVNAESELKKLRQSVDKLNEEKESSAHHYQQCIEIIAKLKIELSRAQENAKQLSSEILAGKSKLKGAEEQCALMTRSNKSLQSDVDDLRQKILTKDEEILGKQEKLAQLAALIQDENSRVQQLEASLSAWRNMHSQTQEDQKSLALELKSALQNLKDLEITKCSLQEEIDQVKEENRWLNNLNLSSSLSVKDLQNDIKSLKEMKQTLEDDVARRVDQSNALQKEICGLKEELNDLNMTCQALLKQVELAGLRPESLASSVQQILTEKMELTEICNQRQVANEEMKRKLGDLEMMVGAKTTGEDSLANVIAELERSKEKAASLQESCNFLHGDKASLIAEKATLLSQLQIVTEMMQKLLEKNNILESSLSVANVELGGLKEKAKKLEDICLLLRNENSSLLGEKSSLTYQLENMEERLRRLETSFATLEEKYAGLENEKKSSLHQVEELRVSMSIEKQEHSKSSISSEVRLENLENCIRSLSDEGRFRKKEHEEELEKTMKAQLEIFILQKFIRDLEDKNLYLMVECERNAEESKISNRVISDLEKENLEQHVETELLLDEIEKLRSAIYTVFRAFQPEQGVKYSMIERQDISVPIILKHIQAMKDEASKAIDEKQKLLIENVILITLIEQLKLESTEFQSEKEVVDLDLQMLKAQLAVVQTEKDELLEMNEQLKMEVCIGCQLQEDSKEERENLLVKLVKLHEDYLVSQSEKMNALEENRSLLEECAELKREKCILENENSIIILDAIASSCESIVLEDLGREKTAKLKAIEGDLDRLCLIKSGLEKEVVTTREKLDIKETENILLSDSVTKMKEDLYEKTKLTDDLYIQIATRNESLIKKDLQLSETKSKLEKSVNANLELACTVEALKKECEDSKILGENLDNQLQGLAKENSVLKTEVEYLSEANQKLEFERDGLREENESYKIKEENLCLEIQDRDSECELWESEATMFYFDLQISSVHEVLYKNKVHELAQFCVSLQEENSEKTAEIEHMKGRVGSLEGSVKGLEAELSAYPPLIASLKSDLASLEGRAQCCRMNQKLESPESKDVEVREEISVSCCEEVSSSENGPSTSRVFSDLQEMRHRIKRVEKVMIEDTEMSFRKGPLKINTKQGAVRRAVEVLVPSGSSSRENVVMTNETEFENDMRDGRKLWKSKPITPEVRNRVLMKDIPLDDISSSSFKVVSRRRASRDDVRMLELLKEDCCQFDPPAKEAEKIECQSQEEEIVYCQDENVHLLCKSPYPDSLTEELAMDMLELSNVKKQNQDKGKVMETLTADAHKLTAIQVMVQNLRRKLQASKRRKKSKGVELETVKEQLQEVEEALVELMEINGELMLTMERSWSLLNTNASAKLVKAGNTQIRRVSEQARKASEKIKRLQSEAQKVQFILKERDEKKTEGGLKVSKARTSIILLNLIRGANGSNKRVKKRRFCGCMRPKTKESDMS